MLPAGCAWSEPGKRLCPAVLVRAGRGGDPVPVGGQAVISFNGGAYLRGQVLDGVRVVREDDHLALVADLLIGDSLGVGVGCDRGESISERDELGVLVPGQHLDAVVQPVQQVPVGDHRRAQLIDAVVIGITDVVRVTGVGPQELVHVVHVGGGPFAERITGEHPPCVQCGHELVVTGDHLLDGAAEGVGGGFKAFEQDRPQQARVLLLVLLLGVGADPEPGRYVAGQ